MQARKSALFHMLFDSDVFTIAQTEPNILFYTTN